MLIETFKVAGIIVFFLIGLACLINLIRALIKKEIYTENVWPFSGEPYFHRIKFSEKPDIYLLAFIIYLIVAIFFLFLGIIGITRWLYVF